jgi:hypothetical protein
MSRSAAAGSRGSTRSTSKYSVVRISTRDSEPPRWPPSGLAYLSTMCSRTRSAIATGLIVGPGEAGWRPGSGPTALKLKA